MKIKTNYIVLSNKEIENLSIIFKKMQYNRMSDIKEEEKLMFYSYLTNSQEIRIADPLRKICKISSE